MYVLFAFLLMFGPFALAVLFSWAAHRHDAMRRSLMADFDHLDGYPVEHDVDAARIHFQDHPRWPLSGAMGERR